MAIKFLEVGILIDIATHTRMDEKQIVTVYKQCLKPLAYLHFMHAIKSSNQKTQKKISFKYQLQENRTLCSVTDGHTDIWPDFYSTAVTGRNTVLLMKTLS